MPEIEEILREIEELRENLNKLAESKSEKFTDPEIVSVSKELDVLLNTYYRLITNKIENFKK
jgi:hypothetical protein